VVLLDLLEYTRTSIPRTCSLVHSSRHHLPTERTIVSNPSAKDELSNGNGTYGAKLPAAKWSDRYVGAVLVIRAKEVITIRQAVDTAVDNVLAGSSGRHATAACQCRS
jgi:hypothetical protein